MRRTIHLLAAAAFMATALPQHSFAQNSGFLASLNELFGGNNKNKNKNKGGIRPSARVKANQTDLNTLGFDVGTPDGISGVITRSAISAYQVSRDFPDTGRLTDSENTALKQDAEDAKAAQSADWILAQTQLTDIGYYSGEFDGKWGPESQQALDSFRAASNLPADGPLNEADLQALETALFASIGPTSKTLDTFDTITLFGVEFALSEPFMGPIALTWADIKLHSYTALPQSNALLLEPEQAQALIAKKANDLGTAYQTQVDILYVLMKPQIQTYAENNYGAEHVASIVAKFDVEISAKLIGGKGSVMIDLWDISIPRIAEVIALVQSTTYQMQALQAIDDNTISVTAVGFDIETADNLTQ